MTAFVDLSHDFEDGMPGFKLKNEDGSFTQYSATIRPFMTHAQSAPKYGHRASFEITEMTFQTSVGTYLDSPYHRYRGAMDISQIPLGDVILPGVVVDVTGRRAFESVGLEALPDGLDITGAAVLFHFGWDAHWGDDAYQSYPFISEELVDHLIAGRAKLVGVDTVNVDSSQDPGRPAHTRLLQEPILVVENLMNLGSLLGQTFRFFAVPIKAKQTAAMPVRAFAEVT